VFEWFLTGSGGAYGCEPSSPRFTRELAGWAPLTCARPDDLSSAAVRVAATLPGAHAVEPAPALIGKAGLPSVNTMYPPLAQTWKIAQIKPEAIS
jgi:hypothetical protein